jgi:UDP-glucose 4-epimerase
MNILVTGGAGFIGTNLISRLLKDGHRVVSIDNYYTGLKSNHIDGVEYLEMDVAQLNDTTFDNLIIQYGKFDIVYHLAAIARIQPSFKTPIKSFESNSLGTFKIAMFCVNYDIPLIYAGSSSHHGGRFKNPYTFSKDIGEDCITLCQTIYKLKCSIARFYNVYGPHHLTRGDYCTLIGIWESRVEDNLPLIIYGDGSKKRDFTHVDDIVDALILIMEKNIWGEIFELGRGKNYSVKEIADAFNHEIEYQLDKDGEVQTTLCETNTAKELLGWNPTKDVLNYIKDKIGNI